MENRQLIYFIAVAEELSFGKAARRLHVTQPAVSRQVKLLEEELSVRFFDEEQKRGHKRIVLTEEGVYFYKEALKILQQQEDSLEGLARLRTRKKRLTLGLCAYLPGSALQTALQLIKRSLPEFEIGIKEYGDQGALLEGLAQDEVMLIAGLLPEVEKEGRLELVLGEGHYVALFSSGDERRNAGEVATASLKEERLVSLKGMNGVEHRGSEVGSVAQLEVAVEEGLGMGIVPDFFACGVKVLPVELCRWGLLMKSSRTGSLYERLRQN
jgi:DNA-binding transcriptional LysR family regulator